MIMKFLVSRSGATGCSSSSVSRVGELCIGGVASYVTPLCMTYTRGAGSVPHLTSDVLNMYNISPATAGITQLNLSTMLPMIDSLKSSRKCLHDFLSQGKDCTWFMSLHDPGVTPATGFNTNGAVCIKTRNGNRKVNVREYVDIMRSVGVKQQILYQPLCDSDSGAMERQSRKRVQKAVSRSLRYITAIMEAFGEECCEDSKPTLVGCIEGGYMREERKESAQETTQYQQLAGFVIEGLNAYGQLTPDAAMEHVLEQIDVTVSNVSRDRVLILPGCWSPQQILHCVERGVDVFDTSYTYVVTERGLALTFPLPSPSSCDSGTDRHHNASYIDLWDKRYRSDLSPLMSTCVCPTCTSYTKAYLHHLVITKELLASVLLMGHNLYRYQELFREIRRTLHTPEWDKLKSAILSCRVHDREIHVNSTTS